MKVLFDHPHPFLLAHGGFQTQIEQTKQALEQLGVAVEWMRWWDDHQQGDIIHFFGRPSVWYVSAAQQKGLKVVVAELLTGLGSRGAAARSVQAKVIALLRRSSFFERMGWTALVQADACVALTRWEARLLETIFRVHPERIRVVPNGVEKPFFDAPSLPRGKWLVCTATIHERKRVLELAHAAATAGTPTWIIGKPYADDDPYARAFLAFVRSAPEILRYEGGIADRPRMAKIYREARGFVLLSGMESLSLSALEAAACECPLLLSDLPWARTSFGSHARYCPVNASTTITARHLREFYDAAPSLPIPPRPHTWSDVAVQLRELYASLAKGAVPKGREAAPRVP